MSIVFDQVDGVVQKDSDPAAPPQVAAAPAAAQQRPAAEQFKETHHRMEWLAHRVAAD
jgi:hypothetical protein